MRKKANINEILVRICIVLIIFCSIFVQTSSAVPNSKMIVSTNRLTILDDPSGWVSGWPGWTARGNQMLGDETTIKWYVLVTDSNGSVSPGVSVTSQLKFPNGTVQYTDTRTTDDKGLVEFSRDLDNINQRPYNATNTEGYWQIDVSADGISSNTRFIYDEIGCGKSGSACHRSLDWQPASGASTKSLINGGTFVSNSKNSPYVQKRDKIHGFNNGHGHVDPLDGNQILSGECMTCHKSYSGTYVATSTRQYSEPQYPAGTHNNNVNCTECHSIYDTSSPSAEVFDMPVKKCYDCHPKLNNNLTDMNYIQDATNSYSYNPLSTANTIKGHNGSIPCIMCHNNGHNITKPFFSSAPNKITEYQQCLTCHSSYENHKGGVDCTVCHSQDAHVIKIFSQNADYVVGKDNPVKGNCTNCHQSPTFLNTLESQPKAGSYTGSVPQTSVEFNHSTGGKWSRSGQNFWSDQLAACKYCHGDTKHKTDALGKPNTFDGTNTVNTYGNWCGSCHYRGNGQYNNMLSTLNIIPPEIAGDSTYGNYVTANDGTSYYKHSLGPYSDTECKSCHSADTSSSLTKLMHKVEIGGASCTGCHPVPATKLARHNDVSISEGTGTVSDNDCTGCHFNVLNMDQMLPGYASKDNTYYCQDCHKAGGRNTAIYNRMPANLKVDTFKHAKNDCENCHINNNVDKYHPGGPIGTAFDTANNVARDCNSCHYSSGGISSGLSGTFRAPGEDHNCLTCHDDYTGFGARPPLSSCGGAGTAPCHVTATDHNVVLADHNGGKNPELDTVSVTTPVSAGTTATVRARAYSNWVQIAKAQYRIDNGAWIDMTAEDGKFDSKYEFVVASINTAAMTGSHTITVRAMDSGNFVGTGGIAHNGAIPYYPDNGVWTKVSSPVTLTVTGTTFNNVWSDWSWTPGQSSANPSITTFNNRLYAMVRGTDGRTYVKSMGTDNIWSDWTYLPAGTIGGPSIAAFNGRLYAMVTGTDNGVYVNYLS